MKHTIGYTVEASLPIQIAYRCSKCGYLNIRKTVLHTEEFGFTKDAANSSVSDSFNARIKAIQDSNSIDALRDAAIEGKCLRCKNVERWSKKEGLTPWGWIRVALFFLLALFIGIPIFNALSDTGVASRTLSSQTQNIIGIGIPIALAVIVIILLVFVFVRSNKKEDIPKESYPVIIAIGENQGNDKEGKLLRQISTFMEMDKDDFFKKIKKYKNCKKICNMLDDLKHMYSEVFSDDLLSSIADLSHKEETEGVSQKEAVIALIEAHLTRLENEIPAAYLNALK